MKYPHTYQNASGDSLQVIFKLNYRTFPRTFAENRTTVVVLINAPTVGLPDGKKKNGALSASGPGVRFLPLPPIFFNGHKKTSFKCKIFIFFTAVFF
jgi:hypothetical protein